MRRASRCLARYAFDDLGTIFLTDLQTTDPSHSEAASKRPITLIDLPGHEKQRFRFGDYAAIAGGVVFVIDATSATFSREFHSVADFLYDVLSSPQIMKHKNPVLVVCNKSDEAEHTPIQSVRRTLEGELCVVFDLLRTVAYDLWRVLLQ